MRYTMISALLGILSWSSAYAACTSPAGTEGQFLYDSTAKKPYFCDGTTWQEMGGGGSAQVKYAILSNQTVTLQQFPCCGNSYSYTMIPFRNISGDPIVTSFATNTYKNFGGATINMTTDNYCNSSPSLSYATAPSYITFQESGLFIISLNIPGVLGGNLYKKTASSYVSLTSFSGQQLTYTGAFVAGDVIYIYTHHQTSGCPNSTPTGSIVGFITP